MIDVVDIGGVSVALWRLEQDAPQLLALCRQAGVPCDTILDLPAGRQRERAAELLLLCHVVGRPVALDHTGQGAPFVPGSDIHISITHTPALVALAWSRQYAIGVDAERLDRRQVLKVRDKYLNASEQQFVSPDDLWHHIIAWTAKEAIIKAERNSAINWTDGICLAPFESGPGGAVITARAGDRAYRLHCRAVAGHCVTVAVPMAD